MRDPEIIAQVPCAIDVFARATGVDHKLVRSGLIALARAGFVVAPREPTNSMFDAYLRALRTLPTNPSTVVRNIGKARLRWKAMAEAGMKIALSTKALVAQLDEHRNSTSMDAGSSPAERANNDDEE